MGTTCPCLCSWRFFKLWFADMRVADDSLCRLTTGAGSCKWPMVSLEPGEVLLGASVSPPKNWLICELPPGVVRLEWTSTPKTEQLPEWTRYLLSAKFSIPWSPHSVSNRPVSESAPSPTLLSTKHTRWRRITWNRKVWHFLDVSFKGSKGLSLLLNIGGHFEELP